MQDKATYDNFIVLKFEDSKLPDFKESKYKEWIKFGDNDDYPDYLLLLANKSAKHNAIINGKVNYIFGNGLQSLSNNAELNQLIKSCNRGNEGLDEIAIKSVKDCEVFAGFYWHIIPNRSGDIADIYHIDYNSIRTNGDRSKFWYKKKWNDNKEPAKEFKKYVKGITEESIFSFREYRQGQGVYPLPNYIAAINYIESDYEVSKQTLSNAKTGFSASKFINFYNGEPEDEGKKKQIERRFNSKFTGSDGQKIIIGFNNDPNKKPTIEDLGSSDLTKEDFNAVDALITGNIYAGHQITSPMLFGIQEPGKLGQSNELKFSYDIFKNTYVNFKQKQIESVLNYFAEIMGIPNPDLKLQDVDPIGIPFTDQTIVQVAPIEWIWEKLGIDPAKYPNAQPAIPPKVATTPPPPGQTNPADSINVENSLPVNENLKNLTAKQHQQIMRIVRQCSKGQMTREAAAAMLKGGWALTDAEVDTFLGSPDQFDKEFTEEEVADMFSEFGESKEHFEIVKSKPARFTEEEFSLTEVFGAKEDASGGAALKPPSKIQKILSEVSIKYSYSVQPGAGPAIIPGTRPFCKKLVELNRLYTREQIQQISQRVGYSVWERRGGFWNNHGTIEPHCRHQWQSHIVIKKT